ncbi:Protein phosphatase 2C (PP2C)-like domain protein [Kalmanozyma brasiliensis GHG001]|uniref:protein-serine/threonine phosphatase n=1 Tax=Kalmanozyma brasiliensis (strain GHG001) TaxID=1365824 RepID=V5GTN9_KALBG|nr:Protein phosphatase 2C (PP2C)-like domain protein [Kalmanozyma brasiliensis GHG001]EST09282.1 Protein phosphatase 2C (PP2C)-like domain protein [Kalmanozyma brasiliensis GHG001]
MGQTLSEPVTEKTTSSGGNDSVLYAISEMQGWRISMEDAHTTILDIKNGSGGIVGNFFGVFDGHGGSSVAQYTGRSLHSVLTGEESFKQGKYTDALEKAFINVDEDLKKDPNYTNDPSGCTAVTAFIKTTANDPKRVEKVFVANAGDSRCVLSRGGAVMEMSTDHKPTLDSERQRIENAGGYVSWGRVNGNLALSRAIGDFEFKRSFELPVEQQIVTAFPEVLEKDIVESEDEFLVLACDGIWDCLSSQDVVDIVRRSVANGKELTEICEDLMDRCLAPDSDTGGIGCDNMTVCVVALLNGRSKEEWYSWIQKNIEVPKFNRTTPQDVAPIFKSTQPSSRGQDSGQDGTVSIQSLLAGGSARGEDGDDEAGGSLRLPGGLAGALSGAGIVFRPGGRSEGGEVVYEAHVVDEDDSGDSDQSSGESGTKASTATSTETKDAEPRLVESPHADAKPASSRQEADKMEVDDETGASGKTQTSI